MEVREIDLPGVGKKFAVRTDEQARVTIIIHNTGDREIYSFREGEEFPFHAVRLHDEEARKLAAILGGAFFQPAVGGAMDMLLEQLSIEWFKIGDDTPLTGRTIRELEIRKRTGANVIAVLRDGRVIPNPTPDERVLGDDTLVVAGTREQVVAFGAFTRDGGGQ